jgi:hypothetical protein
MASSRFLERSVRVVAARVSARQQTERSGLQRTLSVIGGLVLAGAMFFLLKGAVMASGIGLPAGEGVALWLAGPDPLTSVVSTVLQPIFATRG